MLSNMHAVFSSFLLLKYESVICIVKVCKSTTFPLNNPLFVQSLEDKLNRTCGIEYNTIKKMFTPLFINTLQFITFIIIIFIIIANAIKIFHLEEIFEKNSQI